MKTIEELPNGNIKVDGIEWMPKETKTIAKVGEWVVITDFGESMDVNNSFSLNKPYRLRVDLTEAAFRVYQDNELTPNGYAHVSKLGFKFRKAEPKDFIGHWIITEGHASIYKGNALYINKVIEGCIFFTNAKEPSHNFLLEHIERYATPKEIKLAQTTERVKLTWDNCFNNSGYHIDEDTNFDKSRFILEKEAQSALAMAQLSHIKEKANGNWVADWKDSIQPKYCIFKQSDEIIITNVNISNHYLAFETKEIAEQVYEDNKELVETFLNA